MSDRHWPTVWKLYNELRESPDSRRSAVLASSNLPPEAREEVLALLEQSIAMSRSSGTMPKAAAPEPIYPDGTEFGRYVITGLVGEGGFGRVYCAHDKDLRRSVAIKILSARHAVPGENLIEEARSASALNHPNILTIHETIVIDGHPAMVMEFVKGRSLRKELAELRGPLALQTAISFGAQAARALAAAHEVGIIHRDVKPENILVRPDGYIKLVDFGLAASAHTPAPASDWQPFHGTLRYSSPEQAQGAAASPASDVFCLGLVLYEMVTGSHPFRQETPLATADAIARHSPDPPSRRNPSIPKHIDRLILDMLSKDPASRPSASQVADSLAGAAPAPAPAGIGPARRGQRWLAVAALVAVAAGVGALSWRKQTDHPVLSSRPLTSRPATESEPAVTADGKWVAFLSTDRPEIPPRVYWQAADGDDPVQLDVPGTFRALAWTPDGKLLTGIRTAAGQPAAIVSIDPRTRSETQLGQTLGACEAMGLDWSPDGRRLAFPDCAPGSALQAIYVLNPQSGERRKVTSPPATGRGDNRPRFSPDGSRIAFQREASPGVEDVYLIPVQGGEVLRITREERTVAGLAWMPGGQSLAVAALRGGGSYALWRYPAGGRGEPRLLTQAGLHAITPAVGSASGRLLWVSQNVDVNIWSVGVSGGEKPRVLVASTRRDQDPDAGRDGRLAFRSVRTGASEIWISKPDGSQAFRATNLRGPVTGTPTWSPDGRRLAFDSRPGGNPDIYVIECEGTRCGAPKRLTDDPGADVTPDWSVDGEHIYFSSVRTGGKQVWRVDPEGARPEQVTRNGGLQPRESPDGKWLYYVKGQGQPSLWRMPGPKSATGLSPDAEERVLSDDVAILDSADWVPSNDEIFFAANETGLPRPAMHTIRAYHTGTRKFRRVAAPGTLLFSFGISQDLRQILFCQADRTEANIMVSEGIR